MRPRGQTPRMLAGQGLPLPPPRNSFNEAAGADPADASRGLSFRARWSCFNEAAGADPADASVPNTNRPPPGSFNEAAGADPADAVHTWADAFQRLQARLQ